MGTDFNDRVQNRNVKQILRFIQKIKTVKS